ncbi:MAG TPA: DUF4339 domain-containing protein, partial [Bacillota bacterium]|nr:DUF4339 domain-containing protein [Bacillota bacterium]
MELTYMVRGADGKEYGPVTLEQLNKWIQEGRLPAQQEVRRSDMEYWAMAGDFLELQPVFGSLNSPAAGSGTAAAGSATAAAQADPATAAQLKSGASWFYWIAGLSIIN